MGKTKHTHGMVITFHHTKSLNNQNPFLTDQIEAHDPALVEDISHHFADELSQMSNELISTGAVGKKF